MNRIGFIFSSLLVVLALASSMLFVVDQRQFGVVYALGQIKDVILEPGLNFKLPAPLQNVTYLDKRLLFYGSFDDFCHSAEMSNLFGEHSQHLMCHRH